MRDVSLLGVASFLPPREVGNDFFAPGAAARRGMFTAPKTRRHVAKDETASHMMQRAAETLIGRLNIDATKDIDVLFTNVAVPDQAFTGCGAELAHLIGARPKFVIDLHNTGCVSFIYMIELARELFQSGELRGALLCNVQNAAGRVFSQEGVRATSQAPIPGDGCGVGYVAASSVSPVLSVLHWVNGAYAKDMDAAADNGRRYWEPGEAPLSIRFTEERVASIISRGNALVPAVVAEACTSAGVRPRDIGLLVTNQPNPIFLRNWREALEVPPEKHHDTFDRYGNLFGAALPINIEDALAAGKLRPGTLLALGGFAHAGDYTAAAIIRWCQS